MADAQMAMLMAYDLTFLNVVCILQHVVKLITKCYEILFIY